MRYVVNARTDRSLHLSDAPHTRSYCSRLRGALVVLDPEDASLRIATRTAKVCTACRTVLDDRKAADRAMADSFMITADEVRPAARPVVEPGLFDLAGAGAAAAPGVRAVASAVPAVEQGLFGTVDAEESPEEPPGAGVLPVVDAAAVIVAGVPVVGPAPVGLAETGPEGGEEFSELTRARQVMRPAVEGGWENGRTPGRAAALKGWVTTADAEDYAERFPQCVEVYSRFERYEGEFRRSPMLTTVHVSRVEFPARWVFDEDEDGGITITLPNGTTERGNWSHIARTVRAYVLAHRPEYVVAVGECFEKAEKIHAERAAEYASEEAAGLRTLDAVRTDANRARAAFEALRLHLHYQTDEAEEAVYEAAHAAAENAAVCERVAQGRENTRRWWLGLPGYADAVRRAADWLTRGVERVGATMPEVLAVVSVAPDAAPSDPGTEDTWEGEGGAVPGVDTPRNPEAGPAAAQLGPMPGPGSATVVTAADAPTVDAAQDGKGSASAEVSTQDYDYEAIAAGLKLIQKANRAIEARRTWTDKPGADWHVKQPISVYEGTPTYNGAHGTAALYATEDGTAYEVCVYSYAGKQAHQVVRKTLDAAFKAGQKLANQDLAERSRQEVPPAAETTTEETVPAAAAEDATTGPAGFGTDPSSATIPEPPAEEPTEVTEATVGRAEFSNLSGPRQEAGSRQGDGGSVAATEAPMTTTATACLLGTATFNGQPLALTKAGWNAWTADGITVKMLSTGLWGASRADTYLRGYDSPQCALDALAAAEAKAARAATIRAGLTDGQRFARDIRAYLRIGARTHRYRGAQDLHAEILRLGLELIFHGEEFGYREGLVTAVRPALGALLSYDTHIASRRLGGTLVCQYVHNLTPWQLLDLLGEMADAGIMHVGGGERWLQDLNKNLTVTHTDPITGRQTVKRATGPAATGSSSVSAPAVVGAG